MCRLTCRYHAIQTASQAWKEKRVSGRALFRNSSFLLPQEIRTFLDASASYFQEPLVIAAQISANEAEEYRGRYHDLASMLPRVREQDQ
jgi:hypothetical protein